MPSLHGLRAGLISALGVGSLASLSGAGDTTRSKLSSNVLLLIVDDLRAELGGPYGSEVVQSPNIDGLARRGVTMLRAYCQFSMCSPSRSSFLTGVRPDATGVYDLATSFRDRLGPGAVTLPGYFKAHGYATQAVGKVFHGNLDDASSWTVPWQPCDRPTYYTEADEPVAAASAASGTLRMGDTLAETLGPAAVCSAPALGSAPVVDAFFRDGAIALAAVRALHNLTEAAAVSPESSSSASVSGDNEQINPKPPFFLAVGFTKPHLPFVAPEKFWRLYNRGALPVAHDQHRQVNAPPFAVDRGAELFSFADTAVVKPRGRPPAQTSSDNKSPASSSPASSSSVQGSSLRERRAARQAAKQAISCREAEAASSSSGGDHHSRLAAVGCMNRSVAQHIRHGYYAASSYADAQVGIVLDAVTDLHLWDSTVVVLVSDHGFKLGEHGGWSKLSNVEEDTRVPLIVAAPPHVLQLLSPLDDLALRLRRSGLANNKNAKPYRTSDAIVELVDLFPTIADLAGLPPRARDWIIGGSNAKKLDNEEQGNKNHHGGNGIDLWGMQPLEGSSFRAVLQAAAVATSETRRIHRDGNSETKTGADVPWKVAAFSQIARMVGGGGSGGRHKSGGSRAGGRRGGNTANAGASVSGSSSSDRGGGLGLMGYSMRTAHFRLTIWVDCGNDLTVDLSVRPMRVQLVADPLLGVAAADPTRANSTRRNLGRWEAVELYDMRADPSETRNQYGNASYAAVFDQLLPIWQRHWPDARNSLMQRASVKLL